MIFPDFIKLFDDIVKFFSLAAKNIEYFLPLILGFIFVKLWMRYVRAKWLTGMKWVLLEIKLPREIFKTPLAMEVVLNSLYQTSAGGWHEKYFKGRVRNWFSLELVSIEGTVHFFIRTNVMYKDLVETQIYSQYPTAEVYEVPDYTKYIDYKGKDGEWDLWGMDYQLSKEDAYPIKTYVDYGLDKEGVKEEYKTDPITSMLEFLGAVGKNEQIWIQILVQATEKRFKTPGKWFTKRDWKDEGKDLIEGIIKKARKRSGDSENAPVMLTEGETNAIKAIERSISKLGFDCGIRGIYFSKNGAFNVKSIHSLLGAFRQYTSNDLNGFKPSDVTDVDFPWQDYNDIRVTGMKKRIFDAYKRRSYFYLPYKKKPFVLNSEELATIFHFPGSVAETPTFGRISSKKVEPPANLPI